MSTASPTISKKPEPPASDVPTTTNTVDVDPIWLTFPPFPIPPPGATLIPFTKFKPIGIEININEGPDYVEIDGMDIPTLTLRVKHDLSPSEKKRKRKSGAFPGDTIIRRDVWYENWEAGEDLRKSIVDPNTTRVDRLHQASQDFKSGRPWPSLESGIPNLWDAFRLYVGIIITIRPPLAARKRLLNDQNAEGDDEDSEDDAEMTKPPKEQKVVMVDDAEAKAIMDERIANERKNQPIDEERLRRREDFREARNLRMDSFFNDTEKNMKIFFSSYFRDKGLMWDEKRCRNAPILVGFFLKFLLRNRVLPEPEHEKSLRKALIVVEQAKIELPLTFVTSKAIPDDFSTGCEALWGSQTQSMFGQDGADEHNQSEEPDAKRRKIDEAVEAKVLKEAAGDINVEILTPDAVKTLEEEVRQAADAINNDGTNTGGWGDSGGDSAGWPADSSSAGWGTAGAADDWNLQPDRALLMELLGPTAFPLTHTTGIVEMSTRRIKAIIPPEIIARKKDKKSKSQVEIVEQHLNQRLAKMVLAPWHVWDANERADVKLPEILPASRGPVVMEEQKKTASDAADATAITPHNPFKDDITVLITLATVEKLLVGMGVGATWVQVARQDEEGGFGEPTNFWYMEQSRSVLPSFHTEQEQVR